MPAALKKKALDALRGVYLPYWTFDAQVFCPWTAEAGYYYYTTRTVRDSRGRTRTRRVRHTRWKPVRGVIEHFFDDLPIPGTRGVERKLLARIEPFPTHELMPYETEYLAAHNFKRGITNCVNHACRRIEGDGKMVHLYQRSHFLLFFIHGCVPFFGSLRACRIPSVRRLTPIISEETANAGASATHGASTMYLRLSLIILPQSGEFGAAPRPRNPSEDANRIA